MATRRKLTYQHYVLLPDDGKRYEILDGDLSVTPSPMARHQAISVNLILTLGQHVRTNRLGAIFTASLDVILAHDPITQPDTLFVSNDRRPIVRNWVHGAPDLAIEILSPDTRERDRTLKRRLYVRQGVQELSLVDPEAKTAKVCALDPAAEIAPPVFAEPDTLASGVLPALDLSLESIWA